MKILWLTKRWFCAFMILSLTGCYEGWEPPREDEKKEPEPVPIPGPGPDGDDGPKPIYYVLFQPISLGSESATSDCWYSNSTVQFRMNEWVERIGAIEKGLRKISEYVESRPVAIDATDCHDLTKIEFEAENQFFTPPSNEDIDGRRFVNLRAIFWEGDELISPPAVVTNLHWRAWQALSEKQNTVSQLYLVNPHPESGYFASWSQVYPQHMLAGTAIEDVDPTEEGIKARRKIIAKDTSALMQWMVAE